MAEEQLGKARELRRRLESCWETSLDWSDIPATLKEVCMKDRDLFTELIHMEVFQGKPLGIVPISSNSTCKLCKLLIRADRPSFPTVYTEEFGTIDETHFRKHCQNHGFGCSLMDFLQV